jgi:hypothetical protein
MIRRKMKMERGLHLRRIGVQFGAATAVSLLLWCSVSTCNPQDAPPAHNGSPVSGALTQLNGKRNVLLLVLRAGVLDTQGDNKAVLELALKTDPGPPLRHRLAYDTMAKKLNSYIKKYRSVNPAQQMGDADFIILFNLLEYRRILNVIYPYGELFVIVKKNTAEQVPLGIIWKSRKIQWAGDAINDLIRELKTARGEF